MLLAQYIPRSIRPYLSNFQTSDKSFWYNSRKKMGWSYFEPFPLHASEPCKDTTTVVTVMIISSFLYNHMCRWLTMFDYSYIHQASSSFLVTFFKFTEANNNSIWGSSTKHPFINHQASSSFLATFSVL